MADYDLIETSHVPIKAWTRGVGIEPAAQRQLENTARLPIVFRHVAAMPDVHYGIGATVGSVVATERAIIPAAVGVDIGCGMMAVETSLPATRLPDSLRALRTAIEAAVPHGRTDNGGRLDRGAWSKIPARAASAWRRLEPEYRELADKHARIGKGSDVSQLGTLGGGNHFIEVCLDERDRVWFMLHSGSRGVGNRIGTYFIELAKTDMQRLIKNLPDKDLAYLREGSERFDDYVAALDWAQRYALANRHLMMDAVIEAARRELPAFELGELRGQLPSQLRRARASLRPRRARHPQGRGARAARRSRHHPRLDGRQELHRARQGLSRVVHVVQPRRGAHDVARRGEAKVHRRGSRRRDRGHRVPQGRERDRRDAGRVQVDRRGHGGAGVDSSTSCTRCGRSCA